MKPGIWLLMTQDQNELSGAATGEGMAVDITAIILTYNDESNIRGCLESLHGWIEDIVIVDSFSSDKTLEICREYGCRIYQNEFIDQAHQFNWALDSARLTRGWIIRLDSDEVVPEKLKREIESRVGREEGVAGYYMNRRMYWMNRWIRYGRMYPHYILRLFRRGHGRYELRTEEHLVLQGRAAYLKNDFLEDNRKNTLDYFTVKHLKTADGEVREALNPSREDLAIKPALFGTKVQRTRWLKSNVYARAPFFLRPLLYFIYRYFFCLGFLDGKEGLIFHFLQAFWYRFYIDARLYEKHSAWTSKRNDCSNI
jgi:glycosyltransferase involved in cell wall biosynthesis